MAGLAANPLQKAVYDALANDAPLMANVAGVHDEPDENAPLPIVVIGDSTSADNSHKTGEGQSHTLTLHVWSAAGGRMEVKEIMGLVHGALNGAALTLAGHGLVLLNFEFAEDFREREAARTLYHGVLRFRAVTETV